MELATYRRRCELQREVLSALVNKILLALLIDQYSVLIGLKLPLFNQSTLLRLHDWGTGAVNAVPGNGQDNIGEESAEVVNPEEYYKGIYASLEPEILRLRVIVCALLSLRVHSTKFTASAGADPTATSAPALYRAAMASQFERKRLQAQQPQGSHRDEAMDAKLQGHQEDAAEMTLRKAKKRRRFDSPAIPEDFSVSPDSARQIRPFQPDARSGIPAALGAHKYEDLSSYNRRPGSQQIDSSRPTAPVATRDYQDVHPLAKGQGLSSAKNISSTASADVPTENESSNEAPKIQEASLPILQKLANMLKKTAKTAKK